MIRKNFLNRKNKILYITFFLFFIFINIFNFFILFSINKLNVLINGNLEKYGNEVSMNIDIGKLSFELLDSDEFKFVPLTTDDYENIAKSEYVDYYYYYEKYIISSSVITANGKAVEGGTYELISTDDISLINDFQTQDKTLINGKYPDSENEIVVSQQFAEDNNLTMGDEIIFTNKSISEKFTVTAIYINNLENYDIQDYNKFYTVADLDNFFNVRESQYIYHLKSYRDILSFETELYQEGLPDIYVINSNIEELQNTLMPYKEVTTILNNVFNIIIIIEAVLLMIFLTVIYKKSEKDIFKLIMYGKNKVTLMKEFSFATLKYVVMAIIISTFIGIFFSNTILNLIIDLAYKLEKISQAQHILYINYNFNIKQILIQSMENEMIFIGLFAIIQVVVLLLLFQELEVLKIIEKGGSDNDQNKRFRC